MTFELIQIRLEKYSPFSIAASIMGGAIMLSPTHNLQPKLITLTTGVYLVKFITKHQIS